MNEQQIISKWFQKYSNDVYNFLVYYQGTEDVYDLVQETFIKAAEGLHSFRNDAEPKIWLFSIARNVAIDHARMKKRQINTSTVAFEETFMGKNSHNPEKILLENESIQEIYETIMSLRKNYRDVLILRGIEGMSNKETAEILGWKKSKAKQTYYRAKKSFLKQFKRKGEIAHES